MARQTLSLTAAALLVAVIYAGVVALCLALWANVALVPPAWPAVAIGLAASTVAVVAVRLAYRFLRPETGPHARRG
jgi:hypothetical protein